MSGGHSSFLQLLDAFWRAEVYRTAFRQDGPRTVLHAIAFTALTAQEADLCFRDKHVQLFTA